MNDFFSKLENFLFDILGLILPGAIFLLILMSPGLFVDMANVPSKIADTSVILSALKTISTILKNYWATYPRSVLTIAIILAYLMGHTVKVFSRIKYELLTAVFDKGLNKPIIKAYDWVRDRIFRRSSSKSYLLLKDLSRPFKTLLEYIFTFNPPHHFQNDAILKQNCLDRLNTRLSIDYPDDDRSITKISGVISNQENIKTLGPFFLAKYNLYRSLSLIFLFTTLYYIYFFKVAGTFIAPASHEISDLILTAPAILWFTFHVKFKRYWTLYGDERLMSLFYFLNKRKLDEG
jgi:hypothetical protein